jgi:N-methylhydantoinase A
MTLDVAAAKRAIEEQIAKPLNMSVMEAAWAIREVLDSRMADLLRRMTVERGYDPRDFTLFANGGAGPSHAWVLSAELGLDGFVVPAAATAQSAFGTGNSDLGFTVEQPTYVRIAPGATPSEAQLALISDGLAKAVAETAAQLAAAATKGDVGIERLLAMRFRGQIHFLEVPLDGDRFDLAAFRAATSHFEKQYETLFGRGAAFANAGYELLSVRAMGTGKLPPPAPATEGEKLTRIGTRNVVFRDAGKPLATAIYHTSFPEPGAVVAGPAIIEFPGQSVVVPPDATATADGFGNLHVRRSL